MDKSIANCTLLSYENSLFNELSSLESILKLTKNSCYEQEVNSCYYDLENINRLKLSEERNHYLNLLTIALDKVLLLKKINENLENEIYSL